MSEHLDQAIKRAGKAQAMLEQHRRGEQLRRRPATGLELATREAVEGLNHVIGAVQLLELRLRSTSPTRGTWSRPLPDRPPNPGSPAALEMGCTCGEQRRRPERPRCFTVNSGCPLHNFVKGWTASLAWEEGEVQRTEKDPPESTAEGGVVTTVRRQREYLVPESWL